MPNFFGRQSIPRHDATNSLIFVGRHDENSIYLLPPPVVNLQEQRGDNAGDSGLALGRYPAQLPVDGIHDRRMGYGVQPGEGLRVIEDGSGELLPVEAAVLAQELWAELGSDSVGQRRAGPRQLARDLVRVDDGGAATEKELGS